MANYDMKTAPFDAGRMFFGGFKSITAPRSLFAFSPKRDWHVFGRDAHKVP